MHWLDFIKRDPVPWLLDPANPSARYLTLRDIFKKSPVALHAEQQRIVQWPPIQEILQHWNRYHFWGRAYDPYYGSQVGNFGTLYLLAQLGMPRRPELASVCENLIETGRAEDERFTPGKTRASPWLCYTGMALRSLWHFGYGDDLRVRAARAALLQVILLRPELLDCPMVNGSCRSGLVKALDALLCLPLAQRTSADEEAIATLCEQLLNAPYDWAKQDAAWLRPTFPRYYDADLLELCHILAQTSYRTHPRFAGLVEHLLALQTDQGRWCKTKTTPALFVERILQPSRWLTFEAVHTLILCYGDTMYAD